MIFRAKNRVKFGNFVNFSSNSLKSYVVNHYLAFFHNYFWHRPWPQPPELGFGLGLEVLASFNITGYFASETYTRTPKLSSYLIHFLDLNKW